MNAQYSTVVFPGRGNAYRTYGTMHAANSIGGRYLTLCGKRLSDQEFYCSAKQPHKITCKKCCKALGN